MKHSIVLGLFFCLLIFSFAQVRADGAYIPQRDSWIQPGQQQAVIFYEGGVETLVVSTAFSGNASDFVWIIPTPSLAEASRASKDVFANAANLAHAEYGGMDFLGTTQYAANEKAGAVQVLDFKQIDYYDVTTLRASSASELATWLNDNGYQYPSSYEYVLNDYIQRGWLFTAIRISPSALDANRVVGDLHDGQPTPVKLIFKSDRLVFPLKISSIEFPQTKKLIPAKDEPIGAKRFDQYNAPWKKFDNSSDGYNWRPSDSAEGYTQEPDSYVDTFPGGILERASQYTSIQLYVIADGKYEAGSAFYTQYASYVSKAEVEKLGVDTSGNPLFSATKNQYYLTSLSARYSKANMDSDVFFTKSENNKKVNGGPEWYEQLFSGVIIFILVCAGFVVNPAGALFIVGILLLYIGRSSGARIAGWIISSLAFFISFVLGSLIFMVIVFSGGWNYLTFAYLFSMLFVYALMVCFMLLGGRHRR